MTGERIDLDALERLHREAMDADGWASASFRSILMAELPDLLAELRRLRELEAALLDCITTYPIAVGSGAKKNRRLQCAVAACRAAHEVKP